MDAIEFEISVTGSPDWTLCKTRMHLPSLISTVPIITHRDRQVIDQGEQEYILTDDWEVEILRPLPSWITSYLQISMMQVRSTLYWDDTSRSVEWYLTLPEYRDLLPVCEGTIQFEDNDRGTLIVLKGHFDLNLSEIPGIPGFLNTILKGRIGNLAERIIHNYLPDLRKELEGINLDRTGPP